jgi:hypothetical protein
MILHAQFSRTEERFPQSDIKPLYAIYRHIDSLIPRVAAKQGLGFWSLGFRNSLIEEEKSTPMEMQPSRVGMRHLHSHSD